MVKEGSPVRDRWQAAGWLLCFNGEGGVQQISAWLQVVSWLYGWVTVVHRPGQPSSKEGRNAEINTGMKTHHRTMRWSCWRRRQLAECPMRNSAGAAGVPAPQDEKTMQHRWETAHCPH